MTDIVTHGFEKRNKGEQVFASTRLLRFDIKADLSSIISTCSENTYFVMNNMETRERIFVHQYAMTGSWAFNSEARCT